MKIPVRRIQIALSIFILLWIAVKASANFVVARSDTVHLSQNEDDLSPLASKTEWKLILPEASDSDPNVSKPVDGSTSIGIAVQMTTQESSVDFLENPPIKVSVTGFTETPTVAHTVISSKVIVLSIPSAPLPPLPEQLHLLFQVKVSNDLTLSNLFTITRPINYLPYVGLEDTPTPTATPLPTATPIPPPCGVQGVDCGEPNNNVATAFSALASLSGNFYATINLTQDRRDNYLIDIDARPTTLKVAFTGSQVDIDIYVFTNDPTAPVLKCKSETQGSGQETITISPTACNIPPGRYDFLVYAYSSPAPTSSILYQLNIQR